MLYVISNVWQINGNEIKNKFLILQSSSYHFVLQWVDKTCALSGKHYCVCYEK